ncbi:MAG: 5' nucleotidase, NT5C type [Candidatus Odinarchaeia archaeon]|nr:MAG: HAD superfamily/deoxyribonucleotidase [Lokiarchaeota virus Fenrir Meg22_1012]URC17232.1 MAG: 53-deoxyribonucleotidase [Lokiarchaeota virus Fenrir Meg22_1214]
MVVKLAVDLDGVIWDFFSIILREYNRKYKTNIKIEDVDQWSYLPANKFDKIYKTVRKKKIDFQLINEEVPHYLYLLSHEYDVYIVTKSLYDRHELIKMLNKKGIKKGEEYMNLIIVKNNKADLDFDVFIDDCPYMINSIGRHKNKYLLLYDQPWNRYYKRTFNSFRVKDWSDVLFKLSVLRSIIEAR